MKTYLKRALAEGAQSWGLFKILEMFYLDE